MKRQQLVEGHPTGTKGPPLPPSFVDVSSPFVLHSNSLLISPQPLFVRSKP
jgi:hypothetical protein